MAYPGYAGFIPGMISNNMYGQRYSNITRKAFANDKLGSNPYKLSSTGFNFVRHGKYILYLFKLNL